MKHLKAIMMTVLAVASLTASAQLFHPLGLIIYSERQGGYSQPRMHIEGDKLYVCTNKGLYSKDLTNDRSTWQLEGFEDVPLQNYARRGGDILALRYNKGGEFLLLSHDGGQTYEDVTPDIFCQEKSEVLPSLVQHPTAPDTLLISSIYKGIFLSTDFGQTWENLTESLYGNRTASFIGFHPAQPSIIYNSGETNFFSGALSVSYDEGKSWNFSSESLGFPGDNCVHRMAFHPTNPDRWLAGGEGCVFLSDDNGQTWDCQNYWGDESREAYWYFSAFDSDHPDTVYLAGNTTGPMSVIKVMCSTDGGHSWHPSQTMAKRTETESVSDMLQYRDRLLIYTESDIYEISKAELLAQSTAIRSVATDTTIDTSNIYDLQGRRVTEPKHGIFIKDGRKIVK